MPSDGRTFIGIDIGGTHLRSALVDSSGQILSQLKSEIRIDLGAAAASEKLAAQCLEHIRFADGIGCPSKAIGLGVAGKIDKAEGRVLFSPNLPQMNGYLIGPALRERTGLPVFMENDANVFGLGENRAGIAKGIENWIGITMGTGTGGCLFLNGKLWEGDRLGFSAEIGHMIIEPGGPVCACGSRGCLESFASAGALVKGAARMAAQDGPGCGPLYALWKENHLNAVSIYECARCGDPTANGLFRKMGWALGLALANVFTLLGIRHAVIGGGVSAAWDLFIGPLEENLSGTISMMSPGSAAVMRSELGDRAALVGAAGLASECMGYFG